MGEAEDRIMAQLTRQDKRIAELEAWLAEALSLLNDCNPVAWVHAEPRMGLQQFSAMVRYAEGWAKRVTEFLKRAALKGRG